MATDDATPEIWKPVPGYEGLYEVGDQGRTRSLDRVVVTPLGPRRYRSVLLQQTLAAGHLPRLTVTLSREGKTRTVLVHHLVLEAFVGPRPEGQEARHGPGGELDNRLVNLCWGTHAENEADKERDGTAPRGERNGYATLTEAIVLECRRRYASGETPRALAAELGVGSSAVAQAVSGETWAWLPGAVRAGRRRKGQRGFAHHGAKLTPEIVDEIRTRSAAGEYQYALAAEFGVSQATVWRAIRGRTWKP